MSREGECSNPTAGSGKYRVAHGGGNGNRAKLPGTTQSPTALDEMDFAVRCLREAQRCKRVEIVLLGQPIGEGDRRLHRRETPNDSTEDVGCRDTLIERASAVHDADNPQDANL